MSPALNKSHPSFLRRLRFREMMLCCAVCVRVGKESLSWTRSVYTEQKVPWDKFCNDTLRVILPKGEALGETRG